MVLSVFQSVRNIFLINLLRLKVKCETDWNEVSFNHPSLPGIFYEFFLSNGSVIVPVHASLDVHHAGLDHPPVWLDISKVKYVGNNLLDLGYFYGSSTV